MIHRAYSATAVANAFIDIAGECGEQVSNLALQKIVYFSHGWYLGITHKPLVFDDVYAGAYGPVFPALYYSLRKYGAEIVSSNIDTQYSIPKNTEEYRFLMGVYDKYRTWTSGHMVALIHQPDSPWIKAGAGAYPDRVISNDSIMEYYERKLTTGGNYGKS